MKKTHEFGIFAEKISMLFLRLKGYRILEWRYKTAFGEIDIIAKKSHKIIFIEVKARRSKTTIEEVLRSKQIKRIFAAAEVFIAKNSAFHNYSRRFDFIEFGGVFRIKHHRNFL